MSVASYKDLKVWQMGMALAADVYQVTRDFPKAETFGLCSQLQRAAVSIPSNIAEGHARDSTKEFLHHLSFALGSLAEVETQILLAQQFGYLTAESQTLITAKADELGKMLRGLQKPLRAKLQ
ncbi:MAG: four helix bundle protein [Acidobacteria bacterium]|nr:four helix bundle protein [Acidobacteriota bacterium]MBI3424244.1 four helix bundle protein [Acidobacteriota bacterium]